MRCRLSGVVTTLDNASTLEDCLASLAFCDEIVVLDSGSSDATLAIAARHAHRKPGLRRLRAAETGGDRACVR